MFLFFQLSFINMDRIFLNRQTGELLLSIENGFLREDEIWTQVGTLDTDKLTAINWKEFKGRVTIS